MKVNLTGKTLGKYQILQEIGRGAMGAVYQGFDPGLERPVAIKVLAPHLTWEAGFVRRFSREARTAARLNHANIVTIYDVGQQGDWHYFVMEFLEGDTLRDCIRRQGPLSPQFTCSILQQLASALDYAHQQGLIHRDVKPGNVIVSPDGQATLTDFGIVKAAYEAQLTATGTTLGTPEYMSPEQAAEGQVTPSSDLYALAIIAYEMLSGQVPFRADSTMALLYRIVHEALPPLRQLRPDLPAAVDTVFSYALAKTPQSRYPTGTAFVTALAQALSGKAVPAPAVPPEPPTARVTPLKQRRPGSVAAPARRKGLPAWLWALGGWLLAVLILLPIIVYLQSRENAPPPDPTSPPATEVAEHGESPRPTAGATDMAIPVSAPAPEPAPSITPIPTTVRPSSTPRPSQTPRPTPGAQVVNQTANLRSGPGTEYSWLEQLDRGDWVTVVAWANDPYGNRWLLVEAPSGQIGWLAASLMDENETAQVVPSAVTVPPIPPTRPPTSVPTATWTPTPSVRTGTFSVAAWLEWQDSAIWVNAGETVQISASGQWTHDGNQDICGNFYGPGGCVYSHPNLRAPGHNIGALLARIDGGPLIVIGSGRSWRAEQGGTLQMCMNDAPGEPYLDNDGRVDVTVTIWP